MDNKSKIINVAYSSSDSYAWIMCASLYSLLENNKSLSFRVFLLSNGISKANLDKIKTSIACFHCDLNVIDISNYRIKTKGIKINERRDFATFGRLYEAEILPYDVKKIVHIDCDTIVRGNIESLWDIDLSEKIVAGVCDCLCERYLNVIGVEKPNYIFNAGVLVFNLERLRNKCITEKFNEYICKHKKIMYLDQDVLNACIPYDEKLCIKPNFNSYSLFHYLNYKNILKLRKPYNFYSESEILEAVKEPIIVHFTTSNFDLNRPWFKNNHHPLRNEFLNYLGKTSFSNHALLNDNRNRLYKITSKLPLSLKIRVGYFINGFLKPALNKNK